MAHGVATVAKQQITEGLNRTHWRTAPHQLLLHSPYVLRIKHDLVRIGRTACWTIHPTRFVKGQSTAAGIKLSPFIGGQIAFDRAQIEHSTVKIRTLFDIGDKYNNAFHYSNHHVLPRVMAIAAQLAVKIPLQ